MPSSPNLEHDLSALANTVIQHKGTLVKDNPSILSRFRGRDDIMTPEEASEKMNAQDAMRTKALKEKGLFEDQRMQKVAEMSTLELDTERLKRLLVEAKAKEEAAKTIHNEAEKNRSYNTPGCSVSDITNASRKHDAGVKVLRKAYEAAATESKTAEENLKLHNANIETLGRTIETLKEEMVRAQGRADIHEEQLGAYKRKLSQAELYEVAVDFKRLREQYQGLESKFKAVLDAVKARHGSVAVLFPKDENSPKKPGLS
jgi:chromosome segregation ATPase